LVVGFPVPTQVLVGHDDLTKDILGIAAHGAELEHLEHPAVTSHAVMAVDHRPRRVQSDAEGDEPHEGQGHDEQEQGEQDVRGLLEQHALGVQEPLHDLEPQQVADVHGPAPVVAEVHGVMEDDGLGEVRRGRLDDPGRFRGGVGPGEHDEERVHPARGHGGQGPGPVEHGQPGGSAYVLQPLAAVVAQERQGPDDRVQAGEHGRRLARVQGVEAVEHRAVAPPGETGEKGARGQTDGWNQNQQEQGRAQENGAGILQGVAQPEGQGREDQGGQAGAQDADLHLPGRVEQHPVAAEGGVDRQIEPAQGPEREIGRERERAAQDVADQDADGPSGAHGQEIAGGKDQRHEPGSAGSLLQCALGERLASMRLCRPSFLGPVRAVVSPR
jgi:hypothetical protein